MLISYEQSGKIENHPWRNAIDKLLSQFINTMQKVNKPREAEVLMCLFRGCDFDGIHPFALVQRTVAENKSDGHNQNEKLVVGFVHPTWRNDTRNSDKE